MEQLPDNVVLAGIIQLLIPAKAQEAIIRCALQGCGEARDLAGILAQAKALKADRRTVAAAFLFLPDAEQPRNFVDVGDVGPDAFATALLPDDPSVVAAFALARAVWGDGAVCPLMAVL